jgi:hypothetical protein
MRVGSRALPMRARSITARYRGKQGRLTCTPSLVLSVAYGFVGQFSPNPKAFNVMLASTGDPPSPPDKGGYDAISLLPWLLPVLY